MIYSCQKRRNGAVLVRILLGMLLLLMLSFIGVQINDPDGWLWALIYAIPVAALVAALVWPSVFASPVGKGLAAFALIGCLILVWYFWPSQSRFWQQAVWWEEESAREGMGMMIAFVVLGIAVYCGIRRSRQRS